MGEPKRLHPETELVSSFVEAKIFVEVDLTKELPREYFFQVRQEEVCVSFVYPWLPQKCDICKKCGHSTEGCLANGGGAQLHGAAIQQTIPIAATKNSLRSTPEQSKKTENVGAEAGSSVQPLELEDLAGSLEGSDEIAEKETDVSGNKILGANSQDKEEG